MSFPPDLLDEIRARLPVSQLVGTSVKLRRQGREHVGLSPFKPEKTPSFTVNDAKGFYHCFATGEHGDIFTFLMKTSGLTFPEAVERLAAEAGVRLPERRGTDPEVAGEAARLRAVCEASAAWFETQLAAPGGAAARAYLAARGIDEATRTAFRLGYAPAGRHVLKAHLAGLGISAEDAAKAGMLISGDDIPVAYDRFRDRLIFPIGDRKGGIIAFGGRALKPDQQPKYLNSPETPLFHKGAALYNFARARAASGSAGLIVAEGYMDVIALTQAGFAHAVAPLGTALTEAQLALAWSVADEPLLCFDGDGAGRKAAHRAIDTALPRLMPGKSLRFAMLPDGRDPDDLLRAGGPQAVAAALADPAPLVEALWQRELAAGDWSTPERRAALESRIEALTGSIAERGVRAHYTQALRQRLRVAFAPPRPAFQPWAAQPRAPGMPQRNKAGIGRAGPPAPPRTPPSAGLKATSLTLSADPAQQRERPLIALLLSAPELIDTAAEALAAVPLQVPEFAAARDSLLAAQHLPPVVRAQAHADLAQRLKLAAARLAEDAAPSEMLALLLQRIAAETALADDVAAAEAAYRSEMSDEGSRRLTELVAERAALLPPQR